MQFWKLWLNLRWTILEIESLQPSPQSGLEGKVHSRLTWQNYTQKSTLSTGICLCLNTVQRCCKQPGKQWQLILWTMQSAQARTSMAGWTPGLSQAQKAEATWPTPCHNRMEEGISDFPTFVWVLGLYTDRYFLPWWLWGFAKGSKEEDESCDQVGGGTAVVAAEVRL